MKKQVKLTLPEEIIAELTIEADKTGLTVATYIRQVIYQHLQKKDDNQNYHRRDKKNFKQEEINEKRNQAAWKKMANLL